uniref:GRF-type domain-containing protein n=1 Tax=Brassica oleracea var. oleracea TaxID=109376 RepID=A0A0D3DSA4_BRAOL
MASKYPYSQSSSYIGLLNSQHETVNHENYPYGSFHSSVNLGASEIPPFSSQQPDVPDQPIVTPVERRERKKWTPAMDEVLISGWLNTSKDVVVGNDQNAQTFWERVEAYCKASPHGRAGGVMTENLHCKQRWHKINDLTNKFCGAFATAERQMTSGQNDNDVLKSAHQIFYSDHNMKFNLGHAWCVLRHEQKWISLNTPKPTDTSKRKSGGENSQTSHTNVGDNEGKSMAEYTTIWEMKKEDLAMKGKLSKLAILDTLLAKKGPLSEAEEVVKLSMGLDYNYTQPSDSDEYGGNTADNGYNKTEDLIRQDQAEIDTHRAPVQYPPQPEVEFGFPQTCYCGARPLLATSQSRNEPGRLYYTCANVADGDCHVWKWWDVAVMEEMRAMDTHTLQLAEKVDYLAGMSDYRTELNQIKDLQYETEQKMPSEDAVGRASLSPLQKCTAAIRQLAYGGGADTVDEYVRLGETTARKCLYQFTAGIIHLFGDEYLRRPTPEDLQRLLHIGEQRGFPGMVGSIDCMHWEWKNCPTAWKGMYSRGTGKPTIVLEAVASSDLWIWHAFFGAPGTMNDLNILDRSPVFDEIINGNAPQVNFYVNGSEYHLGYYLADGIYPKWGTFIQSIRLPQGPKNCLFAKKQEVVRKDVERAFGVLQARFAGVRNPSNLWDKNKIGNIMKTCIILHNMIVEDERDSYTQHASEFQQGEDVDHTFVVKRTKSLGTILGRRAEVRDRQRHQQLKEDLTENIWAKFGHLPNYNV